MVTSHELLSRVDGMSIQTAAQSESVDVSVEEVQLRSARRGVRSRQLFNCWNTGATLPSELSRRGAASTPGTSVPAAPCSGCTSQFRQFAWVGPKARDLKLTWYADRGLELLKVLLFRKYVGNQDTRLGNMVVDSEHRTLSAHESMAKAAHLAAEVLVVPSSFHLGLREALYQKRCTAQFAGSSNGAGLYCAAQGNQVAASNCRRWPSGRGARQGTV